MFNASLKKIGVSLAVLAAIQLAGCGSPEDRAQTHYERGMKLLAENDFAKAGLEFKSALKLKQDLVRAWLGLARIEERNQNWEALAAILRMVTEHDPNDLEARLRYARLLLLANALDESLKAANFVVDRDGRNASALALKAAILLKLNDNEGAIDNAKAALAVQPDGLEPLIVLAAERLSRDDGNGALNVLNGVPASQAENLSLQLFKIKIYEKLGDTTQMEQALRKIADANPNVPAYRTQLVQFYINQKRNEHAEAELRSLSAANPADHEAGLNLVRFLSATKDMAAARLELVSRIESSGDTALHYKLALAESYSVEGNFADSIQLLEQLSADISLGPQAMLAQVKLADLHLNRKNLGAAESLLADILKKDRRNIDGLRLRSALNLERGQVDSAIADLRQALNDQPRNTSLMLLLAVAYERGGSMELADKQYADAVRVSNFDAGPGLNYVGFLRRRGNLARTADVLTQLADRSPANIEILTALADARLALQNWSGAQEVADAIKRMGNDRGVANQILAASLTGRQQFDEGIRMLQDAYAATPGAVQPMYAVVSTMVRARQFDRAVAFLQTILEKNPSNAEAHVLLGSTQLLMNAPDKALKSYKTAIDKQPENLVGYRGLVEFHLRTKKIDDALVVTRAALALAPDDIGLRLMLASALEQKQAYEPAIEEYEAILKLESGSLVVINNLSSLLSEHRSDETSLDRAHALSGVLRKTQVPQFKDTLAWIHYRRGEHKAAIALLEEAVAELPNVPQVRFHLGMSYLAVGDSAKANDQLKKALEQIAGGDELEGKIRDALKKSGA